MNKRLSIENIPRYIYILLFVIALSVLVLAAAWYQKNSESTAIEQSLISTNLPLAYELQRLQYETDALRNTLFGQATPDKKAKLLANYADFMDETVKVISTINTQPGLAKYKPIYRDLTATAENVKSQLKLLTGSITSGDPGSHQFDQLKPQLEHLLTKTQQLHRLHQKEILDLNNTLIQHNDSFKNNILVISVILILSGLLITGKLFSLIQTSIRQQKAIETELREHKQDLEKLVELRTRSLKLMNEELEAFNSAVSHDLKAPLRHISGYISLLQEDHKSELSEQANSYLSRINNATNTMNDLIVSLLELSRLVQKDLRYENIDLTKIANEIAQQYKDTEPERNAQWEIESGMRVSGDPVLLKTVLANLIDNSWKYTTKTANPVITVNASKKNDGMCISVKDNGAGFDMAYANYLFEPFKRLHDNEDYSGFGVGLSTVKRIILLHNGKIWAKAKPGEGAAFYFTLPDKKAENLSNKNHGDELKRSAIVMLIK